jgi:hypothetical protein
MVLWPSVFVVKRKLVFFHRCYAENYLPVIPVKTHKR